TIDLYLAFELIERGFDLVCRVGRAEEGSREANIIYLAHLRCPVQGRAERGAIVAGGGLHIEFVEQSRSKQAAVGGAIQGYTTGESETAASGREAEMPANMQHDPVEALLKSRGCIAVIVSDIVLGLPRGQQSLVQVLPRGRVMLALIPG